MKQSINLATLCALSVVAGHCAEPDSSSARKNAPQSVVLEQVSESSFRLRTGQYTLTYDPAKREDKKGWIMIRRDGMADGFATKLANGQHLDVTDPGAGEGDIYQWKHTRKDMRMFRKLSVAEEADAFVIRIQSERQWAEFDSKLVAYKAHPGLVRWTVDATAKRDMAFSGKPKPDCFFASGDTAYEWGGSPREAIRYTTQRGPNSGIAYFRDLSTKSYVFYFEDFTSLNNLYRLTKSAVPYDYPEVGNPGAVKMGEPESWFQMSSTDGENVKPMPPYKDKPAKYSHFGFERPREMRIPRGSKVTFADTYLYLKPAEATNNMAVCRNFVEMLGDVYQFIRKPAVIQADWAGAVVPQMVRDIMRPENTAILQGKHKLPRAYVAYEHEDYQLWTAINLLHPLELYIKKFPHQKDAVELHRRLNDALPLYYDKDWKGFHNNPAPIQQDMFMTPVYIFSQGIIMAELARAGNTNALAMITGFRDTLLRMGKAFDYVMADIWLRDFSKQKGLYQADATAAYVGVMMILHELSGGKDQECLEAAKAAANKLSERCMDLMWQANLSAAGVEGCEKVYRATGDERYRDIAFIPLANVLREAWLWECDYGIGEKTVNFWSFSGCPAAPCTAEFENHRTRVHFKNYASAAKGHLSPCVVSMLDDAWRMGPTQSRFTLPPLIIADGAKDILPAEGKSQTNCGEIRYDQMIPLEDFRVGWGTDIEWWQSNAKPGVVGQEIYGAGGPIWYALWQDELK